MQVVASALGELGDLVVGEPHGDPLAGDGVFDVECWQIRQIAAGAAGVSGDAEEVVVVPTVAFGGGVADTSVAASAAQGAFEVVAVAPGSVAGDTASGQHVLDLLPQHVVDEGFVGAVVQDAVEQQLPLVVRVDEQPVELAVVDRFADDLAGGA